MICLNFESCLENLDTMDKTFVTEKSLRIKFLWKSHPLNIVHQRLRLMPNAFTLE